MYAFRQYGWNCCVVQLNVTSFAVFFVKEKEFEMEKNLRNLKGLHYVFEFLTFLDSQINWLNPNIIFYISVTLIYSSVFLWGLSKYVIFVIIIWKLYAERYIAEYCLQQITQVIFLGNAERKNEQIQSQQTISKVNLHSRTVFSTVSL